MAGPNGPPLVTSRPLGCLLMILFLIAEIVVGIATFMVVSGTFIAIVDGLGASPDRDVWRVVSIGLGLIGAGLAVWWVDRQGKRVTGESVFEAIGSLPNGL